jgi:dTMP kinase
MIISFEGIDGTGKTTFAKYTQKYLENSGKKVYFTYEPTNSPINVKNLIEEKLDPLSQALLFMADRVEHIKKIREHLKNKEIVVIDRYVDSTFAYQGSLLVPLFKSKKKAYDYLDHLYAPFRLDPDFTFLFLVDPQLGSNRVENRTVKEYFENIKTLKKVQEFYIYLSKFRNFMIIDSNRDLDTVWKDVKKYLDIKIIK